MSKYQKIYWTMRYYHQVKYSQTTSFSFVIVENFGKDALTCIFQAVIVSLNTAQKLQRVNTKENIIPEFAFNW